MIRALIIDDELAAANVLRLMIERYLPEISDLRIATRLDEARSLIHQFQPEIVFQDIVMPEKNGFEFLSELKQISFELIFTTAFDEYAIKAIRFSALDYLLKPINVDELRSAITRFLEKRNQKLDSDSRLKNLLANLEQKKETDFKLAVPTVSGALFFSPDDIIRLEGEGNYTRFYLKNSQKHLSARTIKDYEEILTDHNFLRIHKSHIVNKKYIQSYLKEGVMILHDKTNLPVSRQRRASIVAALKLGGEGE